MSLKLTRSILVSSLLPILLVICAFIGVFIVRSNADERYEHSVVFSTRHDGRTNAYDNRSQLVEILVERSRSNSTPNVETNIDVRFNNIINITILAPTQRSATEEMDILVKFAQDNRAASSTLLLRSAIEANQQTLTELNDQIKAAEELLDDMGSNDGSTAVRELNGLVETRNAITRKLTIAETDLASVVTPLELISSSEEGLQAPQPTRDAALAAALVALLTLVVLSVTVWRE